MSEAAYVLATGDDSRALRPGPAASRRGIPPMGTVPGIPLAGNAVPTGLDTWPEYTAHLRNRFSLLEIGEDATGYGWFRTPLLFVLAGDRRATEAVDETDSPDEESPTYIESSPAIALRTRTPESEAAARLRDLTGLPIGRLADAFAVSRQTYHQWLNGVRPRGEHRDHLLFASQVIEEAARRLGTSRNVGAWLITPSPGGRLPIDLLAQGRYDLCRALLARRSMTREALPAKTKRHLSGQALRDAMERYSPRPSLEDLEGHEDDDGEDNKA